MSMANQLLLFLLCCLFIVRAFDKGQCHLQHKYKALTVSQKANTQCSKDILSSFPDPDSFAFVLDQLLLNDQRIVRRAHEKQGKPQSNTCYQKEGAVQFNVATYDNRDTVILYFYDSETDKDFQTDLEFKHLSDYLPDLLSEDIKQKYPQKYRDPKSSISHIRVHSGIQNRLKQHYLTRNLREKLMGIYYDVDDFSKIKKPKKLVIGGRSLGAAYATLFYLNLIGDTKTSKLPGFSILPTDPESITVIPICSPMVVFHEDVHKISTAIQSRIFNIINYRDPVVLMYSGKESSRMLDRLQTPNAAFEFVKKYTEDHDLIKLGTNGPIGRYILFMKPQHFNRLRKWGKEVFGSGDTQDVVVKVLDPNEFYINNGAKCLWKNTDLGVFGIHLWPLYHRKKPYLEHIMNSCIYLYLQKSKYWNNVQLKYKDAVKNKKIEEYIVWRGSKKDNKPIYFNWDPK